MPEEVQSCPLCGERGSSLFDRRESRGRQVINHICGHCGLVFQSPRMNEEELDAFYAGEYRQLYQGTEGPTVKDLAAQAARAQSLVAFLGEHLARVARHLDVGCSAGILLGSVREHYGAEIAGIEPGETYRVYAQERGIRVYSSLEALKQDGNERFDLITMAHVLEHLPDPVGYLSRLRESFISPGGWLLIEVPNLYAHDCFEIAHLVSFSEHTLRQLCARAGYTIHVLKAHGGARSQLFPLYLTALTRPAEIPLPVNGVIPERGVGLKRQMGMARRRILQKLFPRQAWTPIHKRQD